jgi:putative flippase GtrA
MDLKNKVPQVIRYFFVGGSAALTDLIIFYLLVDILGFNYVLVSILGFIVATLVNYLLSILFVFESGVRFNRFMELFYVYAVSSVGLFVHLATLTLFIEYFNYDKMASKVIAIISAFAFNYLLRKYFVFHGKKNA